MSDMTATLREGPSREPHVRQKCAGPRSPRFSDQPNYRVLALIHQQRSEGGRSESQPMERGRDMSFRKNLERIAEIYGGIAIFSVDDGSITHRAGVRSGDVLVEVNGRRVKKLVEYAAARKLRKDLLELVVMRDGRMLRLSAGQQASASANEPIRYVDQENLTCPWRGAA